MIKTVSIFLFAVTLLVGFSSVAVGQSNDDETIQATATVIAAMAVGEETQDLEFNNILVNSAKFISATDGSVDATAANTSGAIDGVTGGESRGFFSIEIVGGTNVLLALTIPNILREDGTPPVIPISFDTDGTLVTTENLNGLITETRPDGTNTVSAIPGGNGTDFTLDGRVYNNVFTMPAAGKVYLVLGGEVRTFPDTPPGNDYTANIQLIAR